MISYYYIMWFIIWIQFSYNKYSVNDLMNFDDYEHVNTCKDWRLLTFSPKKNCLPYFYKMKLEICYTLEPKFMIYSILISATDYYSPPFVVFTIIITSQLQLPLSLCLLIFTNQTRFKIKTLVHKYEITTSKLYALKAILNIYKSFSCKDENTLRPSWPGIL